MRHLREERIRRDRGVLDENRACNGAGVERGRILTLREQREVHAVAVLSSGHPHDLEKAAKADGDLAAVGIGLGQKPAQIGIEGDGALFRQVGQPGLAVVRVGREQRPGQRTAANLVIGARLLPGQERRARRAGDGQRGTAGGGEDDTPPIRARVLRRERVISSLLYGSISHYIVRFRTKWQALSGGGSN